MEYLRLFLNNLAHPDHIIAWGGYIILFCIIFAETGLLIGFFLPGDSLLFLTGAYAAANPHHLHIGWLLVLLTAAAIIGDSVGYAIGSKLGRKLYERPNSRFFKQEHLRRTQVFYEKHGAKAIVLARFVPIVRTFVPTVAGVGDMHYRTFVTYNVLGGIGWVFIALLAGYFLGNMEIVKNNFEKAILGIILLSLLPVFLHWWSERRAARLAEALIALEPEAAVAPSEVDSSH